MTKRKVKTYMDELMEKKGFKEKFKKEYEKLMISEQIAKLRYECNLTQKELAQKVHTTKSAISRYESDEYNRYSITLLSKIAHACGAELRIQFYRPIRKGDLSRKPATAKK